MYKNCERSWIQIRRKEIIALLFIILIEILFIISNISFLSSLYKDSVKNSLRDNVFIISNLIKEYDKQKYQKIFKNSDVRFNIIHEDGVVIYDSKKYDKEYELENHGARKEVLALQNNEMGFDIRKSSVSDEVTAYYAEKEINKDGETIIVRVSKSYGSTQKILRVILLAEILFFTLLNIVIHSFYKNYLKRDVYRKIEIIEKYLKDEGRGGTLYFEKDPWILNLWDIVQKWQEKNLENIVELNREKRILHQIITSIDASICLFDDRFKLIIKNTRFNYLYEKDKMSYLDLIKDIEIIDIMKRTIEQKQNQKSEVYIPRLKRYFSVNIKFLDQDQRYLLSVKDITQTKGMIEVQKTFISNISHELKTPLTNIKGYVIALEDAPELLKLQFIKTIKNNIDKLENIIVDFLNITKIESSKIVNIEKISVERLKMELNLALSERIKSSGALITYNLNLLNKHGELNIDFEKVLTIIKNLVENAIVYRGSKIPEIEISIIETKSKYKIGIKDNGIGMAPEDVEKIFERFYRVDKARTSNKAGTGLGLSIVKELVEICGGKIDVLSKEGKGSIFIFTILK
ncbi:two-component sensor histidine kinase [Cetobacterium sp. 8H]|uniref:sensor histidine kinase n=1 Tax=Cetobacterium sp. 8H TaxID=2759681 RepID=UPI00163CD389|nr:ATP-binding protein [Cetobacterium sp. 8H]MBC2851328.1 two-component sensor histidine kinase [Cetobacterium sp. 8H]